MYQLIYASKATIPVDQTVLEEILTKSRTNNHARGITGLLLYKKGRFLQVLEGSEDQVRSTYATIQKDERHDRVIILQEGPTMERLFGNWEMGFKDVAEVDLSHYEGVNEFFSEGIDLQPSDKGSERIQAMLQIFKGIG